MIILDQHILAGYLGRYECEHDVTGKSLESCHIAADGGQYLCYDCLKKAKRPAKVQPLPGVLDHRLFERAGVELGRCDICGTGKAVYQSREARAKVCEGCYARLVREWNRGEGVR